MERPADEFNDSNLPASPDDETRDEPTPDEVTPPAEAAAEMTTEGPPALEDATSEPYLSDETSGSESPEKPAAEEPAAEEPAAEEPAAEEPAPEEPAPEEPAPEEPAAEEPAAEEPAPEEPAPEEPAAEEPAAEEPAAEEPAAEEPAAEEPAAVFEAEPSPELVAAVNEAFADSQVDVSVAVEEEEDVLLDWQPGQWFVVHTYAGYENKVKTNLESRIVSMNMEEKIYEVVIPTEDVMEVKSGKKQVVQRKVFPGYLLVRMELDDDSWYVVRNTPGVTGFVGSGTKPIPLSEKEVDRVLQRKGPEERPKPRLEFSAGDGVRVVTGPFANFQGVISEIDADRSKLKVLVNIFGRETPVELGFDQVAKI